MTTIIGQSRRLRRTLLIAAEHLTRALRLRQIVEKIAKVLG